VRDVGKVTGVWREKMGIAMSNALAMVRYHDSRFLQDFSGRDLFWLLIGVMLGIVIMWVISRRGRRWF